MIQRIQTLYLLIVTALMAVTLFCPIVYIAVDGTQVTLSAFSISDAQGVLSHASAWLGGVLAICTALPLTTIFLFKNRQLQIRLCAAEVVLLVGSLVVMGIYYYLSTRLFDICSLKLGIAMPLLAIVFVGLAIRSIFRDEVLVRSLDRIR